MSYYLESDFPVIIFDEYEAKTLTGCTQVVQELERLREKVFSLEKELERKEKEKELEKKIDKIECVVNEFPNWKKIVDSNGS